MVVAVGVRSDELPDILGERRERIDLAKLIPDELERIIRFRTETCYRDTIRIATHPVTQTQINVPILNEDNHKEWKDAILLQLRLLELDYAVLNEEPPESRISRKIRFCFEDIKKAKPLLKAIDDNFIESKKLLAMTLIMKLRNLRLSTVKGTREHIMQLRDITAQLKELEIILPDDYLVLFALDTLPQEYNPFKISYITHKEDWSINELITMCAMEEQRLVAKLGDIGPRVY
ncbi:PREDICTED: uncharacterized protein LOC109180208 [Ipomoea nil]|uniref:uncharacterized protein LOC109180208 n=1 Tax=Ipomoea nil TaxID=35883 RepID=UPI000900F2C0|nr:PREDICTED: uncharacterized protein LOC109180208 [Ipomoea nil]